MSILLKGLGSLFILLSCSAFGIIKAWSLKNRCLSLEALLSALEEMETSIAYSDIPVEEILFNLQLREHCGGLFTDCLFLFHSGKGISASWSAALNGRRRQMDLSTEDITPLVQLGSQFGRHQREEQLAHLKSCQELLRIQLRRAREQCAKTSGLYAKGGLLLGVFLVLMLI